ncbi:MAG: hypothetical protein ACP5Q4_10520, partial [Candidatus Caldatribacteriaceae bacterium]
VKISSMIGKSLAYILKKPVYGFPTLEVIAEQVREFWSSSWPYRILVPVIFHKRNELFWTEFHREFGKNTRDFNIQTGSPDELAQSLKNQEALIATPWVELKEYFETRGFACYDPLLSLPEARSLAGLYFSHRNQYQSDWQSLFRMVPIYGSKLFNQ